MRRFNIRAMLQSSHGNLTQNQSTRNGKQGVGRHLEDVSFSEDKSIVSFKRGLGERDSHPFKLNTSIEDGRYSYRRLQLEKQN